MAQKWSTTQMVNHTSGQPHKWSTTQVVSHTSGQPHKWSANQVVNHTSVQPHNWSTTQVVNQGWQTSPKHCFTAIHPLQCTVLYNMLTVDLAKTLLFVSNSKTYRGRRRLYIKHSYLKPIRLYFPEKEFCAEVEGGRGKYTMCLYYMQSREGNPGEQMQSRRGSKYNKAK